MATHQPLISVVMSNYNGEKYLAAAIDSVVSQTYKNFEVILIDDGSTDGSVACLESYAESHPKIRLIKLAENKGQANGFNIGIQEAQGTLISFMDSDDLWYREKLESVARLQSENPGAVIIQHNLYIRHGDQSTKTPFRRSLPWGDLLDALTRFNRFPQFTPTSGLTFSKEVLKSVGPIPAGFRTCADGYLTRTAMCFGTVCSTNECWGEYRIHGANATIENPEFSNQEYIRTQLFPNLQRFYIERRIDFDLLSLLQSRRDYDQLTNVRTTQVAKIFLISVTRTVLFRLCRIPGISELCALLPLRLKEQLNKKRIAVLKGKHSLRRAFIIGMGPSLNIDDLNKLKNEITFACNKIYLCFDETKWRPTYYSVIDILVAENNRAEIRNLRLEKIYSRSVKEVFALDKDVTWISELTPPIDRFGKRYFRVSEDMQYGAYGGFTVLFFQIQLALHMGIREIYLLGVDFSFDLSASSGEKCKHGEVLVSQGEVNHFHKDYRKKGETWTVPKLDMQKMAFQAASDYAEKNGIQIFNASRKTELDVFERVVLDAVLGQPNKF